MNILEHVSIRLRRLAEFGIVNRFLDRVLVILFSLTIHPYHWFSITGGSRYPRAIQALRNHKIMVIPDHYYWPLINPATLTRPLDEVRNLPGIDFASAQQSTFIKKLKTGNEIHSLGWTSSVTKRVEEELKFSLDNGAFEAGDAEMLHHVVRKFKPRKVIEIGSGHSTKIIAQALALNRSEMGEPTSHICVEPFEKKWLELVPNVEVLRIRVEHVDPEIFNGLGPGDLLFIDSSHIIRPQGDVLWLYLEILPLLKSGVVVHIHDFFSPRDYPHQWVFDKGLLWNEQYLIEALLSNTNRYKVLLSLNSLFYSDFETLQSVCPHLTEQHNPGSLYLSIV